MNSYVFIQTEESLYTVGFYSPVGEWYAEGDYDTPEQAAERVNFLNGDKKSPEYKELLQYKNDNEKSLISDRFFLEEIVFAHQHNYWDVVEQLTKDWLSEYVEKVPLTEEERALYIEHKAPFNVPDGHYFQTEEELFCFLNPDECEESEEE